MPFCMGHGPLANREKGLRVKEGRSTGGEGGMSETHCWVEVVCLQPVP